MNEACKEAPRSSLERDRVWEIQIIEREPRERDSSSIFKTFVSSKYNFYANLILMDFLNGEINNLNQGKKVLNFVF